MTGPVALEREGVLRARDVRGRRLNGRRDPDLRLPAQHGRIRGDARAMPRRPAGRDLVIVNTCAVTAEAGRQARQAIRRLARERPDARIVVTGCGAQVETDDLRGDAGGRAARRQRREAAARDLDAARDDPGDRRARRGRRHHGGARPRPDRIARLRRAVPAPSCRCRTAATTAAPSASSRSGAATRAPSRGRGVVEQVRRIVAHGGREVVLTGRRPHRLRARPAGPATPRRAGPRDPRGASRTSRACACPPSTRSRPTTT